MRRQEVTLQGSPPVEKEGEGYYRLAGALQKIRFKKKGEKCPSSFRSSHHPRSFPSEIRSGIYLPIYAIFYYAIRDAFRVPNFFVNRKTKNRVRAQNERNAVKL